MIDGSKLFTRGELCRRANIHFQTVASLVRRGIIVPVVKLGRISYYDEGCVDSIVEYYRGHRKRGRVAIIGGGSNE